jgi:hypothetical protein
VQGRSDRVSVLVHHVARWLRDEEAAGSDPAAPIDSEGITTCDRVLPLLYLADVCAVFPMARRPAYHNEDPAGSSRFTGSGESASPYDLHTIYIRSPYGRSVVE